MPLPTLERVTQVQPDHINTQLLMRVIFKEDKAKIIAKPYRWRCRSRNNQPNIKLSQENLMQLNKKHHENKKLHDIECARPSQTLNNRLL